MSRIFWDTNLFVYLLEGSGESFQQTRSLFVRMVERRDTLLTSTLTLGEVLVKPVELGRQDVADRYERLLCSRGVELIPFDREAGRRYAAIRSDRTVSPPEAIQLACAAVAGTNLFITNDARLSRKLVAGVDFIIPLSQAFL